MEFLKNLGETFNDAVDFVVEKNRKFNKTTKIKKLIKKESNEIIKAYITLGKHYYNELRDVPNYDMQKVCNAIDASQKEIKRLKCKLEEVKNEVNLSEFEDFVEPEEPIEIELTLNEAANNAVNLDSDDIVEIKED